MNHRLFPEDDNLLVLTAKAYRALMDRHTEVRCLPHELRKK
jgi:hypothetical protein